MMASSSEAWMPAGPALPGCIHRQIRGRHLRWRDVALRVPVRSRIHGCWCHIFSNPNWSERRRDIAPRAPILVRHESPGQAETVQGIQCHPAMVYQKHARRERALLRDSGRDLCRVFSALKPDQPAPVAVEFCRFANPDSLAPVGGCITGAHQHLLEGALPGSTSASLHLLGKLLRAVAPPTPAVPPLPHRRDIRRS